MSAPLPSGWAQVNLADACDILDARRVPVNAAEREGRAGTVPYYGATGQVGWIDDHLFDEELVLLGEDGAPFFDAVRPKAYIIRGRSWVNNHAHVLRARAGLLNAWLMYQLNALDYRPYVSGSTRLKLPQGPMRQIPLLVPPLNEQRRIVAALEEHLSELDAAVAGLERARVNLRRLRGAATRAAVDGSLLQSRDLVRCAPAPDPWAPAVPASWTWASVDELADLVEYGTSAKTNLGSDGVPVLRMGNIVDGSLSWDALKFLPASHDEFPRLMLRPGDVLFNRTNSPELVGKTAVYRAGSPPASFASYLLRVRLSSRLHPEFFAAYLNSAYGRAWVATVVSQQVGQANVNGTKLRALRVPVPPPEEQTSLVAELERRLAAAERATREIELQLLRAARLRQSILQRAFAGILVPQDPAEAPLAALTDPSLRASSPARTRNRRSRTAQP